MYLCESCSRLIHSPLSPFPVIFEYIVRTSVLQRNPAVLKKYLDSGKLECCEELGDLCAPVDAELALQIFKAGNTHARVVQMLTQVCSYLPLHFKRILLTILTCPPHILTFKNSSL